MKKEVSFFKLHAAGNDCIVFDSDAVAPAQKAAFVRAIADRFTGLGADQVLEVTKKSPLSFQVWNRNGSKAEMCGNGTRAIIALALQEKWIPKQTEISLTISEKPYRALVNDQKIELALGKLAVPSLETLMLNKQSIPYWKVDVGNPHVVVFLGKRESEWQVTKNFDYKTIGERIEFHPKFSQGTNVEFVTIDEDRRKSAAPILQVQVWERGAGATQSSGSGAVAAAAAYRAHTKQKATMITLKMSEYFLQVRFVGEEVFQGGPAVFIARGTFAFNEV